MEDGVSPELRTYGARRLKEKYLEGQVQRIGRGAGGGPSDGVDDPIADAFGTMGAAPAEKGGPSFAAKGGG
eukprot:6439684-Heterocapsa_arctica.AAC.1